ncbi:MAG TPA: macro domain-containing protein [bacterium]|nr:macro domain-containing protein [bacterium]
MIQLLQGNIIHQAADALVNAANAQLMGGGGVDGAIHGAGGASIMAELRSRYPQGCPTGSAVITGAGALKAKYVIHAVGPMWFGGDSGEREDLASAYRSSLELALKHGCRTVVFPSISTGVYDFPLELAAPIALTTVRNYVSEHPHFDWIRFVLFDGDTLAAYESHV